MKIPERKRGEAEAGAGRARFGNHTSKQRADRAICQSFECSLVNDEDEQIKKRSRGIAPAVIARALLGIQDLRRRVRAQGIGLKRNQLCSQASDSMWRMPGHTEAMKAVVSCDKPRGAAHTH